MAETYYAWNPVFDCITKEVDATGATIVEYTHEPKHYGGLISQHRSGVSSVYHYDAIGTARALTDSIQAVTDTAVYTAFGEKVASTGVTVNPFGLVGKVGYYYGQGNYDVRARNYSEVTSRWKSRDPREFRYLNHMYMYCANNPLSSVDPSGQLEQHVEERQLPPFIGLRGFDPCASYRLITRWDWDKENEIDGLIIQLVQPSKLQVKPCKGNSGVTTTWPGGVGRCSNTIDADKYYEVWRIKRNDAFMKNPLEKEPGYLPGVNNNLDIFMWAGWGTPGKTPTLTYGHLNRKASAIFIPWDDAFAEKLKNLGFGTGGKGVRSACELTSAPFSQRIADAIRSHIDRNKLNVKTTYKYVDFAWCCCSKDCPGKGTRSLKLRWTTNDDRGVSPFKPYIRYYPPLEDVLYLFGF